MDETVSLGRHPEIPVHAQRWRYLANKTDKVINGVVENATSLGEDFSSKKLMDWFGGTTYDLLTAMIPTVGKAIPEYEFNGYATQEAWDKDEYDEEYDHSPTVPEVEEALKVAIRVNRFDLAKVLTNLIDPKALREAVTQRLTSAISNPSLNSQQASGISTQTTSSTTHQTSMANEVSLLDDWRRSPQGTSNAGTGS